MKMNGVQFQPGFSTAEFMDRYGSDDKCEAALIESRWPSGFACPACGSAGTAVRFGARAGFTSSARLVATSPASSAARRDDDHALRKLSLHFVLPHLFRIKARPRRAAEDPPVRVLHPRLPSGFAPIDCRSFDDQSSTRAATQMA
jgi:hypothetical protein